MSHDSRGGYRFGEGLPLRPIPPGSTVLVTGPALSGGEDLARRLVADSIGTDESGLFISTNMTGEKLLQTCRRTHDSPTAAQLGIIDCSGQDSGHTDHEIPIRYVSSQSDLTGISIQYTALYEPLAANAAAGRVRTGLISLSSLLMYVDLKTVFQFAQTLAGRIGTTGGLGVVAIDPTVHETQAVNTFAQIADGLIEVREVDDGGTQLRTQGLPAQPDGWLSVSL